MENDRFLVTRKVNLAALPDSSLAQPQIPDPSMIPAKIERSAKDVHEAYLARIKEIQAKRKHEDELKRIAEAQESMLRNFVKKPTFVSSPNSETAADGETSGFNLKRNSKSSNNRVPTPVI